jgi:tartrate dehydratase alpha subunit/fumarate hydratase class I-like protein
MSEADETQNLDFPEPTSSIDVTPAPSCPLCHDTGYVVQWVNIASGVEVPEQKRCDCQSDLPADEPHKIKFREWT